MTFTELLATNPHVHRVSFYRVTCKAHGVFRLLANGVVPDRCPRCSQPARLGRVRDVICASRCDLPIVQRWRADNNDSLFNSPPGWLRQGEIEDC